jgi:hypothetical protein
MTEPAPPSYKQSLCPEEEEDEGSFLDKIVEVRKKEPRKHNYFNLVFMSYFFPFFAIFAIFFNNF